MVAASKPRLFYELQQMVFLAASKEPRELYNYALVASHVKKWIEPILYKKIYIFREPDALRLVFSLTYRSKEILYLFLGTSIHPDTIVTLLHLCPRLIKLNLRAGGNTFSHFRSVLGALNRLSYLRDLSIEPAMLFGTRFVYLPDADIFQHVSRLDLTTTWTWEALSTGFHRLHRLTHLSISWRVARVSPESLQKLLRRDTFEVVVIWRDETHDHDAVIAKLLSRGLDDPRVVVLCQIGKTALEISGGYWQKAQRIVKWRKMNNITTVARPTPLEGITGVRNGA